MKQAMKDHLETPHLWALPAALAMTKLGDPNAAALLEEMKSDTFRRLFGIDHNALAWINEALGGFNKMKDH